jgi:pimeloyl-ACP methyl ester carboxylesterase
MPIVDIPTGERLWYKRTGSGAPLLQIHGSAFGHRNFEKMTPLCARDYEVIDLDLPGYGESVGAPAASMEGIADQVLGFLDAARIGRVNLHGTSFGAMIGLTLTARRPEAVDKLVLSCFLARYDAAARMMRGTWKRAARDSGMEAVADLTSVAGFARSFYERPEAPAQLQSMRDAFLKTTPEAFIKGTETIERTDLSAYAPRIAAPTLLLAGAEDNMTPFKPGASGVGFHQIIAMMPSARLEVLPECGHYLVIEQPELAAEKIRAFLG